MKVKQLTLAAVALAALAILPGVAQADPVTFTLTNPIQSASSGATVTFQATIANLGPPTVFLNGLSFTGGTGGTIDDTPFLSLPVSLTPGQSVGPVNLFQFTINAMFTGVINGSVTLQGGPSASSLNDLGTQDFVINVGQTTAPIPEPTTLLLLGTGLAGAAGWRRKRRQGADS